MVNKIGYLVQIDKETKEGYKYPVSQNYLIGNSAECNLKIAEKNISYLHCRIRVVDNEVHILSLNSKNPVFVNGEAVSEEGKALKDCDTIRLTDNYEFEWNTTDRRIFSRSSLPVKNELLLQEKNRYSDSALTSWKRINRPCEEQTDIASQNTQKDELGIVEEAPTLRTESVDVSIPCESTRHSFECGVDIKRLANPPIKSGKSKNPVSPFAVSNTFVSESKSNTSKVFHQSGNDEMELECTTKNIPDDVFEELIMQHTSSQTAFHSTPKVVSGLKSKKNVRTSSSSLLDMNFENNSWKLKSFDDTLEKNDEFNEKSSSKICNQNEEKKTNSTSKKTASTPKKRASEGFSESRRNTRGRTSSLRKTFEENSCDNENKSLTTPEKLTETNNVAENSFPVDSEIETVTDTNTEHKFLDESSKSGFASVSDENVTCEGSFIDKYKICNVVRSVPDSKNASVAKCVRNLSCISPPENNRSQEYMDSMTTTQKDSPSVRESTAEDYDVSLTSCDDTSMDRSLSSARKRRSTGFTPFVGTPSNEYRVTRKMSTPFSRSLLSRTSVDLGSNAGLSRDGKHSSERRSTPFKAPPGKSSIRDSISCQPTIPENVSSEELEGSNHEQDSTNDSKFRFITMRRGRRYGENAFAAKEKILEESELKSDDSDLENDGFFEEENTEISVTNTSTFLEADELSIYDKTETETAKDVVELKSILTPPPKSSTWREKSAKRVTFVLPNSPECMVIKENSTLSVDESFAMISTSKPNHDSERSPSLDNEILEEELHLSSRQETNPSYNSLSELGDDSSVTYSTDENCDESSLNGTGACSTKIQSNLNDLSGVEQIEPSPTKCATIIDTSEQENIVKADTLFETSNITSSFVESSNRSNICEEECTETRSEIGSPKKMDEIIINENLENSSLTKVSFSPGIHLSGVKSLFNTPEKLELSSVNKTIKCNLNFKASPNSKTNLRIAAETKSFLARKSVDVTKSIALNKSSRMCKSLNLNEIVTSKTETLLPVKVQIEESKVTDEVSENEIVAEKEIANENKIIDEKEIAAEDEIIVENETAVEDEIVVEKEIAAENEITVEEEISAENKCNVESISNEEMIETDVMNGKKIANREPPQIIITETTFVDENANDEPMESLNESQTEFIEPVNVESSSTVQPEDIVDKFETSEFEEESVEDCDGPLSSESDINDDDGSPVLTQIRRSALPRTHSTANMSSTDDEIQPKENKSLATTSIVENEDEKEIELNSSSNTPSENVPSESTNLSTNNDNNEVEENVSQSSLDVMVSDFENSKLSDVLSTECMGDADSLKTSINLSSCNDSQLSDLSSKDISDLDSVKANIDDSNSKISDLSPNNTNNSVLSNNSIIENELIDLLSDNLISPEDVGSVNFLKNNVNRKTEIVECLSAEIKTQNTLDKNQKDSITEEICDTNLVNVSQSTSTSQDMGIRIDASSALINDLHKKLESTPQISSASQKEATPTETFERVTFPESTNISSIECTSQSKSENFNKPDATLFIKNIDDVLTPIKTALRGSSTPQSTVRRCRKSSRIHRCNPDNTLNKLSSSLHECSVILDNSSTPLEAESANESKNLSEVILDHSNTEPVTVEEKTDPIQELFHDGNISENCNAEFATDERKISTTPILPAGTPTSSLSLSPSNKTALENESSTSVNESSNLHTKEDGHIDHSLETQTIENVCVDQQEAFDVREVAPETCKVSLNDETTVKSINISIPRLTNETTDLQRTNDPTVDTVQGMKKRLRTRRVQLETPVEDSSKEGVVTRNRQRGQLPLWLGKDFHCYFCLNFPENSKTCARKTTTKQVDRKLNEHDDKENVCSLPKVADKSKKTELPKTQITTAVPPKTEKQTRKPPRRLKNLENNVVDEESLEIKEDVFSKRSCSIVLPLLDPEIIIKSPVKVDESGNISAPEDPSVATKRKRVTKTDNGKKKQVVPTVSRTRQKQIKKVTFKAEEEYFKVVAQQTDEDDLPLKATTSKRKLRNQPKTVETEVITRSKRTAGEPEKKLKIERTIKIQLQPVENNIVHGEIETVEKKSRPKRGAAVLKNTKNTNKNTSEQKAVPRKPAKRAPEITEESIPKRRRGKTEVIDEIPSKKITQPKNDEIVTESPKRSRVQTKTVVQAKPVLPAIGLRGSTRATKNKPLKIIAIGDDTGSKKRTRDVGQLSALNDYGMTNKRTKMSKNTELDEPDNKTTGKKTAKKTNITKENSYTNIPCEKPTASSSKTIPPSRITRSRKTTIFEEDQTEAVTKKAHLTKTKKAPVSKSSPTLNLEASDDGNKSAAVEKVKAKRAVVTRSKNVSIKKGRISSTLKTSGRGSVVSRKSAIAIKPSPAKVVHENNLVTSNLRRTRRRAK